MEDEGIEVDEQTQKGARQSMLQPSVVRKTDGRTMPFG